MIRKNKDLEKYCNKKFDNFSHIEMTTSILYLYFKTVMDINRNFIRDMKLKFNLEFAPLYTNKKIITFYKNISTKIK